MRENHAVWFYRWLRTHNTTSQRLFAPYNPRSNANVWKMLRSTFEKVGIEVRPLMLSVEAAAHLRNTSLETFPFMAYELGFDSVQIRTADALGGSAGRGEIVLTSGASMARPGCSCDGCEAARVRVQSCAWPEAAPTCTRAEVRAGWLGTLPCGCSDSEPVLNCVGFPVWLGRRA